MKLPYQVVKILGRIAEAEALAINVPMVIAFSDENGHPLFFGCMDRALPASREIAVSKAYTASVLRMDTKTVGVLAQPGEALYGIQNSHDGKIILFGGGMPLTIGGDVVGGIGVSGGTVEEDETVAKPVTAAFDEMVKNANLLRKILPGKSVSPRSVDKLLNLLNKKLGEFDEENVGSHDALILAGAVIFASVG